MHRRLAAAGALLVAGLLLVGAAQAQPAPDRATKTTFVALGNNANALIMEPVTPDPQRGRFAILLTHPDHTNTFGYFIAPALAKRGYRVMMMNYYGPEREFDEFLTPLGAAVKKLRAIPGVQKVVLVGHSTGGAVLTYYQDVAENGPKACQEPGRIYPCRGKNLDGLPPADGVMILDSNSGAVERLIALDPSDSDNSPRHHDPALDLFSPANGYNPATKSGVYTAAFKRKYLQAQSARQMHLIEQASARLAKIEANQGDYKDDEPFVVRASSNHTYDGARLDLADLTVQARTHAPHPLLKADGSMPVQIIQSTRPGLSEPEAMDQLNGSTQDITVRHFLSYLAMRTKPDYSLTADQASGIEWRSTGNSIPGNVQGIKAPTLFVSGTCAPHLVFTEIAFDLSAAKDKEFVGVDGGDHYFKACKPEYGDPATHAFDYVDSWLMKPGRF